MTTDGRFFFYGASNETGIYRGELDAQSGEVSSLTLLPGTPKSFFLARHPVLRVLYSLNIAGGKVGAFSVADDGGLTALGEVDSAGAAPCHLAVDVSGRALLVANYNGGVSLFGIEADGALTPAASVYQPEGTSVDPRRQDRPHPHGVALRGDLVYVADLGTDRILALRVECDPLKLTPVPELDAVLQPGAGPRHFTLHRNGNIGVAVNELDNTVTSFRVDPATGALIKFDTLPTLPSGHEGETWTAEIEFHPSADLCYATNRGHDSLAVFAVDAVTGALQPVAITPAGGKKPQHVTLNAAGSRIYVANTGSNQIAVFQVDETTGHVKEQIGELPIPSPMGSILIPY